MQKTELLLNKRTNKLFATDSEHLLIATTFLPEQKDMQWLSYMKSHR